MIAPKRLLRRAAPTLPLLSELSVIFLIQFVPLATLSVFDYSQYAAVYLVYGVCYGAVLAVVCDAWARARRQNNPEGPLLTHTGSEPRARETANHYARALGDAALISAAIAFAFSLLLISIPQALLVGLATFLGVTRSGTRYRLLGTNRPLRASAPDFAGVLVGAGLWASTTSQGAADLTNALLVWNLTLVVAVLANFRVSLAQTPGLRAWIVKHQSDVRTLLGEAMLLNVSSAATPYVAWMLGGPVAMALVRSATSFLYPVRLIMGVMRPRLISAGPASAPKGLLASAAMGAPVGLLLCVGLHAVSIYSLFPGSTFHLLSEYAIEVGVLALVTTISVYGQFVAKGSLSPGDLILRRLFHSIFVTTIIGATVGIFGAASAPFGIVTSTTLTIFIWFLPGTHPRGELHASR